MEQQTRALNRSLQMLSPEADYAKLRDRMVELQLRSRGLSDERVLAAMATVPRERFVPPSMTGRAYADGALSIGRGQTISQPYMVALMTQSLHLQGAERVLEIGTGSGYQAAVLAEVCREVYTVERIPELADGACRLLTDVLGYGNIHFKVGDGTLGWAEEAPFDRIIVTAGAPARPETLIRQLSSGGEAVVPVGSERWQCLTRYVRDERGTVEQQEICDCIFVKLIGQEGW
jgi:protein-L-isoaspartate(D-aspartate) O-methyltransferase